MNEPTPILVAEDNDDDYHFLRRAVRMTGINNPLLRFRDGAELTSYLEQLPHAEHGTAPETRWLLLLDLGMPMMNGFEVLRWLQQHKGLPKLRTVVLSGFHHDNDIKRAMELGASDYCVKPITVASLSRLLLPEMAPAGS
jgi:two-component system response regulator